MQRQHLFVATSEPAQSCGEIDPERRIRCIDSRSLLEHLTRSDQIAGQQEALSDLVEYQGMLRRLELGLSHQVGSFVGTALCERSLCSIDQLRNALVVRHNCIHLVDSICSTASSRKQCSKIGRYTRLGTTLMRSVLRGACCEIAWQVSLQKIATVVGHAKLRDAHRCSPKDRVKNCEERRVALDRSRVRCE
jgi:hypothetical protein